MLVIVFNPDNLLCPSLPEGLFNGSHLLLFDPDQDSKPVFPDPVVPGSFLSWDEAAQEEKPSEGRQDAKEDECLKGDDQGRGYDSNGPAPSGQGIEDRDPDGKQRPCEEPCQAAEEGIKPYRIFFLLREQVLCLFFERHRREEGNLFDLVCRLLLEKKKKKPSKKQR